MSYLPELREAVGAAAHRRYGTDPSRARRRSWRTLNWLGRWRPLVVFAVLLAGATSGALAAAGVFGPGAPVVTEPGYAPSPRVGLGAPNPGGTRLFGLRVTDPAGGPPWGLAIVTTTRGFACPMTGRVVRGRLGVLGIDYEFGDDQRFHPLRAADAVGQDCSRLDRRGHVFAIGYGWIGSASGSTAVAAAIHERPRCRLPGDLSPGLRCPQTSLRVVYYGFAGPAAASISYTYRGRHHVERVSGANGGYLVVAAAPADITSKAAKRGELPPPFTLKVTDRAGITCPLATALDNAIKGHYTSLPSLPLGRGATVPTRTLCGHR